MHMVLFGKNIIKPDSRVFHIAPELGLSRAIRAVDGVCHEAYDIDPPRYAKELAVQQFDLARDTENLPSNHYDVIIHSHVMEHILCDVTAVLFHLHRALKPNGMHVFCIPILSGYYEEDLRPLTRQERTQRFGQFDHVRKYGTSDIKMTIGKVFPIPDNYDLESDFGREALMSANIDEYAWRGITSHTIFAYTKDQILLKA